MAITAKGLSQYHPHTESPFDYSRSSFGPYRPAEHAGGVPDCDRRPKARRGRFFIVQFTITIKALCVNGGQAWVRRSALYLTTRAFPVA